MSLSRIGPTLLLAVTALASGVFGADTFTNPLLPVGPDPWVVYDNGYYYFTSTTAVNLTLWRTHDITDLKDAEKKVIWVPPSGEPYSAQIWAPELHKLAGKWYIYFAADGGIDATHRLWVLQDQTEDPFTTDWKLKGEVRGLDEHWAIDATVFENNGKSYIVWSGKVDAQPNSQYLYIARLKSPWQIAGEPVLISKPQYDWERVGADVNEGPEILKHDQKIFLVFSGSGCWTDRYTLGMLVAAASSDLLKASSWTKIDHPVLSSSPEAHAFGTGHNTFFESPDGKQDWILYHANPEANEGCGRHRSPRAQPFTWDAKGYPDFGTPIPLGTPIPKPSGTPNAPGG